MQVFYAPNCQLGLYPLPEEESKHLVRVLRMKQGDPVFVVDGNGNLFEGNIQEPHPKHCILNLTVRLENFEMRPYRLHIAISPLKNADRFEWFIEKAIEIGIDEITPLLCHRTERKSIHTERLNRIIESAMKQSLKAYHPILNPTISINEFLQKKFDIDEEKAIAHCLDSKKLFIGQYFSRNSKALILIGPEGDFTLEEISQASMKGFQEINLGKSRLRSETAGITACHSISFINA
jgi:16S rRNA (uracil1498-N3)-methyltransferase